MTESFEQLTILTGYNPNDSQILENVSPITQQWADDLVNAFYDMVYSYAPTASVFREGERQDRETTFRNWYLEVTRGALDDKFWKRQWFVGLLHIKRRVSNNYMLGMTSRIQQVFLTKCFEKFAPDEALLVYGAFKRTTDVVAGLIADSYFTNYMESLENVLGFKRKLIDTLLNMEVNQRLAVVRES